MYESRDIDESTYRAGGVSKSAHLQKRGQTDAYFDRHDEETVAELQHRYEEKWLEPRKDDFINFKMTFISKISIRANFSRPWPISMIN